MTLFLGIEPGQSRDDCAGATRQRVTLAVQADAAVAVIGDRRIGLSPSVLVLWHSAEAGTWHGIKDPVVLETMGADQAPQLHAPADIAGVELTSQSGAGDIAGLAIKVDRPLAIVTSGYRGRRGWRLRIVDVVDGRAAVVWEGAPSEWRAKHATVETL